MRISDWSSDVCSSDLESQERMLMVLKPGREDAARAIFEKWGLDFAIIGRLTETGHMVLRFGGEVVADLPIAAVADGAPEYDRPHVPTPPRAAIDHDEVPARYDPPDTPKRLVGGARFCDRRLPWERPEGERVGKG